MQIIHKHISKHQKAIAILEAIEKCNRRIREATRYLNNNQHVPWFKYTKDVYSRQYNKYKAIRTRLYISYAATCEQIIYKPVESNAKPLGIIVIDDSGKAFAV